MSTTPKAPPEDASDTSDKRTPTELSEDKVFHILQSQRRRDALRYLKDHGESSEMRALAEQVAAWENDTTVASLSSDERQRVYIALYQSHLPKLDEEGIINYNQSRGKVELCPLADQLEPYLRPDTDNNSETDSDENNKDGKQWFRYYRYTSAAGVGTLAASLLGLPLISNIASLSFSAFLITVYVAITTVQTISTKR